MNFLRPVSLWELDPLLSELTPLAIVGRGRLGLALAQQASRDHQVVGPLPRTYRAQDLEGVCVVLLCVPDQQIAAAAETLAGRLPAGLCPAVGHCSGASTLSALDALVQAERFSLHPLMSFSHAAGFGGADTFWEGASAAVSGSSPRALRLASELARRLGLNPFVVQDADRAAYHAAASIASNFLVTLQLAAERLAHSTGTDRSALEPLVRQTVENWAAQGAGALTGPIARGDHDTVARQRQAVAERTPELLELFDVLANATRKLASGFESPVPVIGRAA